MTERHTYAQVTHDDIKDRLKSVMEKWRAVHGEADQAAADEAQRRQAKAEPFDGNA